MEKLFPRKRKGKMNVDTNDYVKYLTETLLGYLEAPKEERKKRKRERKMAKDPFLYRWFGIVPYYYYRSFKQKRKKGNR